MSTGSANSEALTRISFLVYLTVHFAFIGADKVSATNEAHCQVSGGWLNCTGSILLLPIKSNGTRLEWNVTEKTSINPEDFKYANHFNELVITGKTLTSIASGTFEKMDNLINLTVTSTEMSTISAPVLRGLDNLERLDLSNNRFTKLNDVIPGLTELANLRYLSLANNQISNVTEEAVETMSSLSEVDLTKNPLRCDCGLMPLRPYILDYGKYSKQHILFIKTDFCGDPIEKRNVQVASFMMRIYHLHCSSVSELMFTVYFVTTALLCAGFLCAVKETAKKITIYLNSSQPSKDKRIERKDIKGSGLQVKTPLLEKSADIVSYD